MKKAFEPLLEVTAKYFMRWDRIETDKPNDIKRHIDMDILSRRLVYQIPTSVKAKIVDEGEIK